MNDKRRSQERYLIFTMSLYMLIFILAWTPYAAVSFISAFIDDYHFDPLVSTIPALFAKSSVIWSSMFYLCTDEKMKNLVKTRIFKFNTRSKTQSENPGKIFEKLTKLFGFIYFLRIIFFIYFRNSHIQTIRKA